MTTETKPKYIIIKTQGQVGWLAKVDESLLSRICFVKGPTPITT